MESMLYCCCGLDLHKDIIEACILKGTGVTPEIIRESFGTKETDLKHLVEWLERNNCFSVAMESTGVYWMRVYDVLNETMEYKESVYVVNAHHMKNVPGKKSDVKDAEWIADLFRHGMLRNSFIPERQIRELRDFTRLLRTMIQEQSRHKNRIEKFLQSQGFKFSSVMSDVFGATGMKLLNILKDKGKIDENDVLNKCQMLKKHPMSEIALSVCGTISDAERLLLTRLLEIYNDSNEVIAQLKEDIKQMTADMEEQINLLKTIPGISEDSAREIIAEISDKPEYYFPDAGHLCAWAGLKPRNDESAKKYKSRKILHGNSRLKSILCQVAWVAVYARESVFHDWYWPRVKSLGQKKAIIAVSRKILSIIYLLLSTKQTYRYPV